MATKKTVKKEAPKKAVKKAPAKKAAPKPVIPRVRVKDVRTTIAEAKAGAVQALNPISSGKWRLTDLLVTLHHARDRGAAKRMLVDSKVKVNGETVRLDYEYPIDAENHIELTVELAGSDITFKVIGG